MQNKIQTATLQVGEHAKCVIEHIAEMVRETFLLETKLQKFYFKFITLKAAAIFV